MTLTKRQLIDIVARKAHLPKKASEEAINVFLDEIGRHLSKGLGSKVKISGFGTIRVIMMKGKTVKLPGSDKTVAVKSHRYPSFSPGEKLKRQVRK